MRKKVYLVYLFIILPSAVFSQDVSKLLSIASDVNWVNSSSQRVTSIKPKIGGLVGIGLEYEISNRWALHFELNYKLTRLSFETPLYVSPLPEIVDNVKHEISSHTLSVPLFINIKSNSGLIGMVGIGLYWNIANLRSASSVQYDYQSNDLLNEELIKEDTFKYDPDPLHTFFAIGFGQIFNFKDHKVVLNIRYLNDLTSLLYPTVSDPETESFDIRIKNGSLGITYFF